MVVEDLEVTTCPKCGCYFGVPHGFLNRRREDKAQFYCPTGHTMSYSESTADKMRRERDRALQQVARAEQEAAEARRETERVVKAKKRLEKRAAAGTCPCCQRTFSNMSTHMKRQHPEFVADTGAKVVPIKAVSSH